MDRRHSGVSVVKGEVSLLLSATRRVMRWTGHGKTEEEEDPLIHGLHQIQDKLNRTDQLRQLDVDEFVKPFCVIVQSDDTTGPITGMAISSLDKFLAYGLIDPAHPSAPSGVEMLSEAVTHARFVGTNPASDEVVLMKILQVLHTLLLSPVGPLLSNESVCEIMQSCFRICFESRLSELLRCFAESTLLDMVQLLFTRLSSFSEDTHSVGDTSSMDQTLTTPQRELPVVEEESESSQDTDTPSSVTATDGHQSVDQSESTTESHDTETDDTKSTGGESTSIDVLSSNTTQVAMATMRHKHGDMSPPYGLPCVRELLRFLITIVNPEDKHNSDSLMAIGLNLVTTVIECGSAHLCRFSSITSLVQDSLCKNLLNLLRHDNFTLFSQSLRCCFLLFESNRSDLKLQLEVFVTRLLELVSSDNVSRMNRKELALECIMELCYLPHFTAELYVNFDCGLYCTNVFENLTKVLSKNAFPTQGTILPTHLLSLDALLAIVHNLQNSHMTSHVIDHMTEATVERKVLSLTQLSDTAGLIFTTSEGQEVKQEVVSSIPQEMMSSSSLSVPTTFHQSESLPALTLTQMKALSRSDDVIGRTTNGKPASGYQAGIGMCDDGDGVRGDGVLTMVDVKPLPSSKELLELRQRKKLVLAATEQFNKKPKQGISFLMEQGILSSPLNPEEVGQFLIENPGLDKTKMGDYIGDRRNTDVLEAFVRKSSLYDVPIEDALRAFLESFRLPGESPIVERILEVFSEHWLDCNQSDLGRTFANADAVHVLTYAIMMLNTDLHSNQVRTKMKIEEFIRNQRNTNKGENFPPEFLTEIYHKIKDSEIIMPQEHKGAVKENYLWKVMLHRSNGPEGNFLSVTTSEFDQDLFLLSWGPTIAALSYVYDNADDKSIVQKAISGFTKCAGVAAHYDLKEVFDNIIITLCKFTTLLNSHESSSSLYYLLGVNPKVRLSVQTMFSLAHRHGNILREGWKNLLDCLLTLFKTKVLPEVLIEVPDFLHSDGKVSLFREEAPVRNDSSILSSLYSYWLLSNDQSGKALTPSEIKARKAALTCIQECHPELLFTESKYLRPEALQELIKALTFASRSSDHHVSLGTIFDEEAAVFFMELLVAVAIENKDRISLFWSDLSLHLSRIIVTSQSHAYLLERTVVGLLRLVIRLLGRDFMATQLLLSLRVLLTLPPPTTHTLRDIHKQTANGIAALIQTHAHNIKTPPDWSILFTVLEFAGSGLPTVIKATPLATVATETGTEELESDVVGESIESHDESKDSDWSNMSAEIRANWVWISNPEPIQKPMNVSLNSFDLLVQETIPVHEPQAFFKCCETLAYLVRSEHFVSSYNFSSCINCIRRFSEVASSRGALEYDNIHTSPPTKSSGRRERPMRSSSKQQSPKSDNHDQTGPKSSTSLTYATASLRLLDLLDALFSRVGTIFDADVVARMTVAKDQSDQNDNQSVYCPEVDGDRPRTVGCGFMWHVAWCPLLQGMARMCCDSRRAVRQTGITYLQRALLAHDLQDLSGLEWYACFLEVFFPMLSRLLGDIEKADSTSVEETRVRSSNLLCKVFLQHLPSLSQLTNFVDLWIAILDFMDKFIHLENSDLLYEAIPESLKNMLLVMSTQGIFDDVTMNSGQSGSGIHLSKDINSRHLWQQTWNRIEQFLPKFLQELFPNLSPPTLTPAATTGEEEAPPTATPTNTTSTDVESNSMTSSGPIMTSSTSPLAITGSSSPLLMQRGGAVMDSPYHTPLSSPPLSNSPELHSSPETVPHAPAFPITLHPPLPTLITSPSDRTTSPSGSQTSLNTSQTGLGTSQTGLSSSQANILSHFAMQEAPTLRGGVEPSVATPPGATLVPGPIPVLHSNTEVGGVTDRDEQ